MGLYRPRSIWVYMLLFNTSSVNSYVECGSVSGQDVGQLHHVYVYGHARSARSPTLMTSDKGSIRFWGFGEHLYVLMIVRFNYRVCTGMSACCTQSSLHCQQ